MKLPIFAAELDKLANIQRGQLTTEEARELKAVKDAAAANRPRLERTLASAALEFAKEHTFERVPVAKDHELIKLALQHGRGQVGIEELKAELRAQQASGALVGADGQLATKAGLDRESRMIAILNRGADLAVCLQGAAGTGKSQLLGEIARYNEALRDQLKADGKRKGGQKLDRLEGLNWTAAQREDVRQYKPGQVLVFHKPVTAAGKNEESLRRSTGGMCNCGASQRISVERTARPCRPPLMTHVCKRGGCPPSAFRLLPCVAAGSLHTSANKYRAGPPILIMFGSK